MKYFLIIMTFIISSCGTSNQLEEEKQQERMMEIVVDTSYMVVGDGAGKTTVNAATDNIMDMSIDENINALVRPISTPTPISVSDDTLIQPTSTPTPEPDDMGDITYILNDTMTVGVTDVVKLTISKYVSTDDIVAAIPEFTVDNITTDKIRTSYKMIARLVPAQKNSFDITNITSETQIIENNQITQWIWNCTPLIKGKYKLNLSIDIIVDDNVHKTIRVYDGFVYVYSNLSTVDIIMNFFEEQWKWFLTTLIIPLFLYYRKKLTNKKK